MYLRSHVTATIPFPRHVNALNISKFTFLFSSVLRFIFIPFSAQAKSVLCLCVCRRSPRDEEDDWQKLKDSCENINIWSNGMSNTQILCHSRLSRAHTSAHAVPSFFLRPTFFSHLYWSMFGIVVTYFNNFVVSIATKSNTQEIRCREFFSFLNIKSFTFASKVFVNDAIAMDHFVGFIYSLSLFPSSKWFGRAVAYRSMLRFRNRCRQIVRWYDSLPLSRYFSRAQQRMEIEL